MTTVKSLSREMKFFLLALIPIYFISVGLIIQPFDSIVTGIYEIIREPDFLITDYIAVGGMGAAFVNAGMMALISIYFVYSLGMGQETLGSRMWQSVFRTQVHQRAQWM